MYRLSPWVESNGVAAAILPLNLSLAQQKRYDTVEALNSQVNICQASSFVEYSPTITEAWREPKSSSSTVVTLT